jgi:hypothetical protein
MVVAKDHFEISLDLARRQGALSWELRAAESYGRLLHAHGRTLEAYDLLNSVDIRFTEGSGTAVIRHPTNLDALLRKTSGIGPST